MRPRFAQHLEQISRNSGWSWSLLALHLLIYVVFYQITALIFSDPLAHADRGFMLPMIWMLLVFAVALSWLLLIARSTFWRAFVVTERAVLMSAALVAAVSVLFAVSANQLWGPLGTATFQTSSFLLGLWYDPITSIDSEFILGTENFVVHIGQPCSGYEGIGLVLSLIHI